MPKKESSEWIMLEQVHPNKNIGLVRLFVKKESVEYISRVLIEGNGFTNIVYRDKYTNLVNATVLDSPESIMKKLSY